MVAQNQRSRVHPKTTTSCTTARCGSFPMALLALDGQGCALKASWAGGGGGCVATRACLLPAFRRRFAATHAAAGSRVKQAEVIKRANRGLDVAFGEGEGSGLVEAEAYMPVAPVREPQFKDSGACMLSHRFHWPQRKPWA